MPDPALLRFADLPLQPASFAATLGAAVVVAPHPDDESLGCGGLLALLRQARLPVSTVLVSDGTMSHPNSRKFPAPARRALREAELRDALRILGVDEQATLHLGLPDGAVPTAVDPGFAAAVEQLRDFLAAQCPQTVLLPWRRDPHPDHRATSQLVHAACRQLPQPPRLVEYVVSAR